MVHIAKCIIFFLSLFFCLEFRVESIIARNETNNGTRVDSLVHIGLVLDLNSTVGAMAKLCVDMALSEFYSVNSHYGTRLFLHTKYAEDALAAAFAVDELVKNEEIKGIIGAQIRSTEAAIVTEVGRKAHVPILSFSATSPASQRNPYLTRTAPDDSSQVKAIAAILQGFGWHEVVILYQDTEYGFIPHLTNALIQEAGIHLSYMSAMSTFDDDSQIRKELNNLKTKRNRVFLVHMTPSLGSRFFVLVNEAGMMREGYAWIITDGLSNFLSSMDDIDSMEGVLGIRPHVPKSKDLEDFKTRWKKNSTATELNIFGLWAYDTVWALAMAVEKIGPMNSSFLEAKHNKSGSDISPRLLVDEILDTRFKGLSGEFHLVDGQLQPNYSAFEIFNLIGTGGDKTVGYWTPDRGISRDVGPLTYSTSTNNVLKTIIWPGDSTTTPKGSDVGKKLRILVPFKIGFTEFVKVTNDAPRPNHTVEVTGFSIEVFRAALKLLPGKIEPEFYAFVNDNGTSAGSYNDLIRQISNGTFDAVVGDATIVANRTQYADFALPYSESGVRMVVRIKHEKGKDMWIFLKPFGWDLWLSLAMVCIFVGLVVRILEHGVRDSTEFKGPTPQQLGMLFWFPLSVVAFPERKMVANNWSRIVLVVWMFMAFILMQSFTANLSSMLTVDQLQTTFSKPAHVGYQNGSFVKDLLVKRLNFTENKTKAYETVEEYHRALSNGSVDAIFDEIPYLKLFLHKYPSQYVMVGRTYKTDGFGFAFPLGSGLVANISRAILNVTQGENMTYIERKYFGCGYSPEDQDVPISPGSRSLSAYNFGGLFVITGSATILALLCSESLFRQRVVAMTKHYSQKCFFSSRSNRIDESRVHSVVEMNVTGDLPIIDNQENPPRISNQRDGNISTEDDDDKQEEEEEVRSST